MKKNDHVMAKVTIPISKPMADKIGLNADDKIPLLSATLKYVFMPIPSLIKIDYSCRL